MSSSISWENVQYVVYSCRFPEDRTWSRLNVSIDLIWTALKDTLLQSCGGRSIFPVQLWILFDVSVVVCVSDILWFQLCAFVARFENGKKFRWLDFIMCLAGFAKPVFKGFCLRPRVVFPLDRKTIKSPLFHSILASFPFWRSGPLKTSARTLH